MQRSIVVFGFYLAGSMGMLLFGTYILLWNLVFSEKITITSDTISIQRAVPGFGRSREFPTSTIKHFRIAKGGPYENTAISYEFLGVGVWNVEMHRKRGMVRLLKRINQEQAYEIAKMLRARKFNVELREQ